MIFSDLTIVTSSAGYGKYLSDWANSIGRQTIKPGRVCIFTHGGALDDISGQRAALILGDRGISAYHTHCPHRLDLGVARNRAVELAETEWVIHLDADDLLLPHAVSEFQRVCSDADVVQAGYERIGQVAGLTTRRRIYEGGTGIAMLSKSALCSGNSMFRRSFWLQSPYREDLLGAWDTCLWIGFARLGARFRPTATAVFQYRQHTDSVFNKRRTMAGWSRVYTNAMIKKLRRGYEGVAIIVPRDLTSSPERERNWQRVKRHYQTNHPSFQLIEGYCSSVQWVKGAAIQDALNRCTAEVIVIADADVMVSPEALVQSIILVASGFAWAMPHTNVFRANPSVSAAICESDAFEVPHFSGLDRAIYEGVPGGGIVVLRHVMYDAIGGIPFAFRGWGSEDRCLAMLCDRLIGPCERGSADLVHLWHPPQATHRQSMANVQLLRNLGVAAQHGRDSLVQAVSALPKPSFGPSRHHVIPIDHGKIASRMEQRRLK